jgi:hypothetical protein
VYFVSILLGTGVFLRCVIGFLRYISQIERGAKSIHRYLVGLVNNEGIGYKADTGSEEPDYTYRYKNPRRWH